MSSLTEGPAVPGVMQERKSPMTFDVTSYRISTGSDSEG